MTTKNDQKAERSYEEKLAAKKATVLGEEIKDKKPLLYTAMGICALVLVFLGVFIFNKSADSNQAVASAEQVTHPVNLFEDGKARHFQVDTKDGLSIKYFVLKSSDGTIRAAFDACDVCWPAGKGYFQEGDTMVCRNCGKRFSSVKVNEVRGGCNPAPLDRKVVGDNLVIQVKDILAGGSYFDFSRRS